jgi:hypothetical protein
VIARISIQEAEKGVLSQSLKHLVNEGERIVILPGGFIEFTVVDTHSPSGHSALWD